MDIKLSLIDADPEQPRQEFNPVDMDRLEKSIREKGIMAPLVLEKDYKPGRYLVIDGERRYRTAKKLKLVEVPATLIQGPLSGTERMVKRFHLQEQIASWSHFDKARAIYYFKDAEKLTTREIADMLGYHQSSVANWCSILELSKRGQTRVIDRRISFSYLVKVARAVKYYADITDIAHDEIESKIIDKIENGMLRNSTTMSLFTQFIAIPGNKDRKLKFLNDPNFSFFNLMGETSEGKSLQLDRYCYRINQLNRELSAEVDKKLNTDTNPAQEMSIKRLISTLKEFVK
jgi:ParB/RepB/Spo0J family partition protein